LNKEDTPFLLFSNFKKFCAAQIFLSNSPLLKKPELVNFLDKVNL
jgi:hypothetical protein